MVGVVLKRQQNKNIKQSSSCPLIYRNQHSQEKLQDTQTQVQGIIERRRIGDYASDLPNYIFKCFAINFPVAIDVIVPKD